MLKLRQFFALASLAPFALLAACKRGEPTKTLLLYDSPTALPRRFDDVRVLSKRADYVKFRTASGEVIELTGRYTIQN